MLARLSDHGTKMNKQMLYRVRRKDIMPASRYWPMPFSMIRSGTGFVKENLILTRDFGPSLRYP